MVAERFLFDNFMLDPGERSLQRDDTPVELNARYLDALALLVRDAGRLVSKERFLADVWRGVPVTDEALTQCIRTLRRQLGDDAARPRFIETVPKHGYRFIAPVAIEGAAGEAGSASVPRSFDLRQYAFLGGAGTLGGGVAGLIGGLLYGFAAASQPLPPSTGALSVFLVLLALTTAIALVGGAGVAFGIAASSFAAGRRSLWIVAGGAAGGLIVGALVKLIGLDAFGLLFGQTPGDITGAPEGALLGGGVGFGAWLAGHRRRLRSIIVVAALAGGLGGVAAILSGGRLWAGSLDLIARHFPASRLRLDAIGSLFGEGGFGPLGQIGTGILEGALFGACIVGAMTLARRALDRSGSGLAEQPRRQQP